MVEILSKYIDKEELELDSKKLAEYNRNINLKKEIDKIRNEFVDELGSDWETASLICKFAERIKSIL